MLPYPIEQPGPFGIWLATEAADVIVYQSQTTPAHQEHIILHEVGHIIAGHDGEESGLPESGDAVSVLRRTAYDSRQEREAELIATILHEWAGRSDGLGEADSPAADPSQAAVLDRIGHALSGGGDWT